MTGEMFEADAAQAQADAEDREAREDFPTPRALVRAALEAAVHFEQDSFSDETDDADIEENTLGWGGRVVRMWDTGESVDPVRVLDVCAGSGVWASEMRRLSGRQGWPVHITGVEIDEGKREHLDKWCDVVHTSDWLVALSRATAATRGLDDSADIAMGNPHFTALADDDPEQSMPAVLLRHAPAVLLLHTQQAFIRGRAGRRVLRAYPRAHVWDVPGSVSFTPDGKADARCYQVSLWLRGHSGTTTQSLLPEPPNGAGSWRYSIPPGTEEPSEDLPAAPGWSP